MTPEYRDDIFGPYEMPSTKDWAMQVSPGSILYYSGRSFFHRSERIPSAIVELNKRCILPDLLIPDEIIRLNHNIETIGWRPWTDVVMNAHAEVGDFLYQWMKFVISDGQTVYDLREALGDGHDVDLQKIVGGALKGPHGDYVYELFDGISEKTFVDVFAGAIFDRKARGAVPVTDRESIWRKLRTFQKDDAPGQVGELQELMTACLAMEQVDSHNARFGEFFIAVHQLIGFFENQQQFQNSGDGDKAFFDMLANATTYVENIMDALPGVSRKQLFEFALAKQKLRMDVGQNARAKIINTKVDTRAVTKSITALYEPYLVWRNLTGFYELSEEKN